MALASRGKHHHLQKSSNKHLTATSTRNSLISTLDMVKCSECAPPHELLLDARAYFGSSLGIVGKILWKFFIGASIASKAKLGNETKTAPAISELICDLGETQYSSNKQHRYQRM